MTNNGTVKRVVSDKGFGFIKDDSGDNEYFFHRSEVKTGFENLQEGDRVTFEAGRGPKGPRAEDVRAV